mgnify:CR=1 FL=1
MKNKKSTLLISLIIIVLVIIVTFLIININRNSNKERFDKSDTIIVKYAYSLGVQTVESLNSEEKFLDILEIKLSKKQVEEFNKILNNNLFELDSNIESTGISGIYQVIIGEQIIYIDQEEALYTKDKKTFYKININEEVFDYISDIVFNETEKNFKKLESDKVYISNDSIGEATIEDETKVKDLLNTLRFVKVERTIEEDNFTEYYLDLNNGITITIYQNNSLGLYKDTNNNIEEYILFYTDPKEYLRVFLNEQIEENERLDSEE